MRDYFHITDTRIGYTNETDQKHDDWLHADFRHYGYFHRCLNMLRDEGFTIQQDPGVAECIRRDYWIGRRGDLEVYGRKYPNGFEIFFFQNVFHENPHGGRYDFDKLEKMPYIIRLQYQKYMKRLVDLLETLADVENRTEPRPKTAEERIKVDLVYHWHHYKNMDFDLHDLDGTAPDPKYAGPHGLDKNKKVIRNGDMKYFRHHWNGYLMRGRVYYRANMHWWAIINDREAVLVDNWDLFDDFPSGDPARLVKAKIPESYKKHREELESTKTKELIAELRRRGLKVSV